MEAFVDLFPVRVSVVTWNVNAKIETNILTLRTQLLGFPGLQLPRTRSYQRNPILNRNDSAEGFSSLEPDELPEMVIVGFQEIIELSTSNVLGGTVIGQNSYEQLSIWQQNIEKALNYHLPDNPTNTEDENEYVLLARQSMVGLGILVFTQRSLRPMVQQVQVSCLARGVGGVLGNKGAVYVRCKIFDSTICIVNAHFTAHRENVEKRNSDFWAILSYPAFPDYLSTQIRSLDTIPESHAIGMLKSELKSIRKKMNLLQALPIDGQLNGVNGMYFAAGAGLSAQHLKSLSSGMSADTTATAGAAATTTAGIASSASFATSSFVGSTTASQPSSLSSQPPPASSSSFSTFAQPPTSSALPSSSVHSTTASTTSTSTDPPLSLPSLTSCADDHDIILWLGDLNYRIVQSVHIAAVYDLIDTGNTALLASLDQLSIERENNRVFAGFNEGLLTFAPTYQFVPGQAVYARESRKQRVPAWCDRVLWRTGMKSGGRDDGDEDEDVIEGEEDARERGETASLSRPRSVRNMSGGVLTTAATTGVSSAVESPPHATATQSPSSATDGERPKRASFYFHEAQRHWSGHLAQPLDIESVLSLDTEGGAKPGGEGRGSRERTTLEHWLSTPLAPSRREKDNDDEATSSEDDDEEVDDDEEEVAGAGTSATDANLSSPTGQGVREDSLGRRGSGAGQRDSILKNLQRNSMYIKRNSFAMQQLESLLQAAGKKEPTSPLAEGGRPLSQEREERKEEEGDKDGVIAALAAHHVTDLVDDLAIALEEQQQDSAPAPPLPPPPASTSSSMEGDEQAAAQENGGESEEKKAPVVKDMSSEQDSSPALPLPLSVSSLQAPVPTTPLASSTSATAPGVSSPLPPPPPSLSSLRRQPSESVELMQYTAIHSLNNSDHKPVRALLNVKVKRMHWAGYEQTLQRHCWPMLTDPLWRTGEKLAASSQCSHPATLPPPPPSSSSSSSPPSPSPSPSSPSPATPTWPSLYSPFFHNCAHERFAHVQPQSVSLLSLSRAGDCKQIVLSNRHPRYLLNYEVLDSACASWLNVSPCRGCLPPGESAAIELRDSHYASTQRLVEEIEAFGAYDSAQLPNLAKCLQLPPNLPQMSISAILCIQISYHSPNKTLGERSVAEELFVPVVCVLSL